MQRAGFLSASIVCSGGQVGRGGGQVGRGGGQVGRGGGRGIVAGGKPRRLPVLRPSVSLLAVQAVLAILAFCLGPFPSEIVNAAQPRAGGSDRSGGMSVERTGEGIWIREGGEPVCFYQRRPKSLDGKYRRANYLHPVHDLQGRVWTEDFPADHRHHRGIFWAWHQVLVEDKPAGDPWATRDFQWDVRQVEAWVTEEQEEKAPQPAAPQPGAPRQLAVLRTLVHWKSPRITDSAGQPAPLVEERCVIRVHASQDDHRRMDFEIQLRALRADVRLGGSDDVKGYGGFSVRMALTPETKFLSPEGQVTPRITAVDPAPWIDTSRKDVGVTMLAHPSLPNYPPPWILRQARSMQNPVYPGRSPVQLPRDKPLVLRYALVIHGGAASADQIRNWHADFAADLAPPVPPSPAPSPPVPRPAKAP